MSILWVQNPYSILFAAFWISWTVYFTINVLLFFKHRDSFYIKTRSPWLIFTSACGQYLMITTQSWKIIIGPKNFSNFIDLWFLWFMIPLHFVPYPLRSLRFIIKYHTTKAYADKMDAEERGEQGGYSEFWYGISEKRSWITDNAFLGYSFCFVAVTVIIGLIRLIAYEGNRPGHNGYGIGEASYISSFCMMMFISIFLWVGYYFMKNVHDEIAVNSELLLIGITWIVGVPLFAGFGYANLKFPEIPPEISPICDIILCIISFLVSFAMPVSLASFKDPNFELKVPEFQNVDAFLNDPEAYKLLKNFMQDNYSVENILFLGDASKISSIVDVGELEAAVHKIYDRYIIDGSPLCLNIHYAFKDKIKSNLGHCTPTIFDEAIDNVKKMINTDQIPKIHVTDEMTNYIKNLRINTIPENNEP